MKNIAILGASGALGNAITHHLSAKFSDATIHAFSRTPLSFQDKNNISFHQIEDYCNETSLADAVSIAAEKEPLDLIFVALGLLHDGDLQPEKSLRDLSADNFQRIFEANMIAPALIAKHFLPKISRTNKAIFAALSARVGSISDNRLGGWYAYRASKAALNMILKNAALETARRNKNAVILGLHPGTVDSGLSKPFQSHVPTGKLFTPEYSAEKMTYVMLNRTAIDSGKCFDWDNKEIMP